MIQLLLQKKWTLLLLLSISLLAVACKQPTRKGAQTYIDIPAYLNGQLAYLDTVPFALMKVRETDSSNRDTSFIDKTALRKTLDLFLLPVLKEDAFSKAFTETSFADASLNTITLTFDAIDAAAPLQRINIYVNPETNEVQQLYMMRRETGNDSVLSRQLLWNHNRNYSLITTLKNSSQQEQTITEKISWNDPVQLQ